MWKVWIIGLGWECEVLVETFLKYITVTPQKCLNIQRPSKTKPELSAIGSTAGFSGKESGYVMCFFSRVDTALEIFQAF